MKKITKNKNTNTKFICPITRQLINEIAITSDGFFYEKSAIEQWLKTNNTSPQTGLVINKQTYPCIALQNQLEEFYNNNPLSKAKRFQKSKAHADNLDEINNIIANAEYTKLLNYNEFNWLLFDDQYFVTLMENINSDVITHIINNTPNLECEYDDKWRPIHYVCNYQSIDAIKLLVDKGVDLECENNDKYKPIHYVCCYRSIDVIKLFVDNSVDLECQDNDGWRPIHYVCYYQSIDAINAIKLLVDNGVDLECESIHKWRPIHLVCQNRSFDAIKLLVDNSVNLECENDEKMRPIHYVCQYQSIDAIKLLVDNGVNLECEQIDKWRPIHIVCEYQSIDAIKLLVDSRVDLNTRIEKYYYQSDQENDLQYELKCNFDVLMLVLLNSKCDFNEKEKITTLVQYYIK